MVSARQDPGDRVGSVSGPIRVRTSRTTGCPTASHILRTCRFRPSWMTIRRSDGATVDTRAGAVVPSSSSTPSRRRRTAPADGSPSTSTRYSLGTPNDGWVSRWVSPPSLVRIRRPSLSMSSRPTGKTRGSGGTRETTVGRPWVSSAVLTTPTGLLRR